MRGDGNQLPNSETAKPNSPTVEDEYARESESSVDDSLDLLDQHTEDPAQRSAWPIGLLMLAIAGYLYYGIATMKVSSSAESPGPTLFPLLIAILVTVVGIVLLGQGIFAFLLRKNKTVEKKSKKSGFAWSSLGLALFTFIVFLFLLQPLGWLISGVVLFFGIAVALGSRKWFMIFIVGVIISSAIQIAFSIGLGLQLPSGTLWN